MPGFVNYKKGSTRLTAANDKVYQLLAHGWWFYPGTPASSTTKTGRHELAEILLKVALNTNQSINVPSVDYGFYEFLMAPKVFMNKCYHPVLHSYLC